MKRSSPSTPGCREILPKYSLLLVLSALITVSAALYTAAETSFHWYADKKTGRCLDTRDVRNYSLHPDTVELYFSKKWQIQCAREQDGERLRLTCRSSTLYYFKEREACRETARRLHSEFLKRW